MKIASLKTHFQTARRRQEYLAALFLGLIGLLLLLNARYLYNCAAGPFRLSGHELAAIKNPQFTWRYYVTVSGSKPIMTPFLWKESKKDPYTGQVKSESLAACFLLLPTRGGFLVIKSKSADAIKNTYTGELSPLPQNLELRMRSNLEKAQPGLGIEMRLFNVMLSPGDDFERGLPPLFYACQSMLFAAIFCYYKSRKLSLENRKSILSESLMQHGNPEELIGQIDEEIKFLGGQCDAGPIAVLQNWLLLPHGDDLRVVPMSALIWTYPKERAKGRSRISSETQTLVLQCKQGTVYQIKGKTAGVDQAVNLIAKQAPWIYTGYNPKVEQAWQSNRAQIIEQVEAREKKFRLN